MKSVTIFSVLMAATATLASPMVGTSSDPDAVARALLERQDPGDCPGGKDFNFCVPWLNTFNCPPPDPQIGGPDSTCPAQNTKICACWCSCSREQCDAASLPFPDYC